MQHIKYRPINLGELLITRKLDKILERRPMRNIEFSAIPRAFHHSSPEIEAAIIAGFFQVGDYILQACNHSNEAYGSRVDLTEIKRTVLFLRASSEANLSIVVRGDIVRPSICDGKPYGRCNVHARLRDMDICGYSLWT